jgi:maltodextrin utilization protein YvdJ
VRRSRRDFCALLFLVLNLLFSPVAVHAAALADFSLKLTSLVHDKQKPDNDKLINSPRKASFV